MLIRSALPYWRLYGHRRRRLRRGQEKLVNELLPRLSISPGSDRLDARRIFESSKEIWLEIGFGAGEHFIWQAENHPDIGCIGCEPFLNGVAKALVQIQNKGLENVRLFMGDARDLLDRMPPGSVSRVFVLFPDPWPKKRHHKRRLIRASMLDQLSRVLSPGGIVRVATDISDHCRWILRHFAAHQDFDWLAERAGDWRNRGDDWPETRYEAKAKAAGRTCVYLTFAKVSTC